MEHTLRLWGRRRLNTLAHRVQVLESLIMSKAQYFTVYRKQPALKREVPRRDALPCDLCGVDLTRWYFWKEKENSPPSLLLKWNCF